MALQFLVSLPSHHYGIQEEPQHTALKNEMLRHYRLGAEKMLTFLSDEHSRLEAEIEAIKEEMEAEKQNALRSL